jgi:uncharacterized protein (TIGR02001 family)
VFARAPRATHRTPCIDRGCPGALRAGVALLSLIATNSVFAQFSGDATVVSDYRYRGVSLSQGNAEPQVGVTYDSPAGWYAGGLAAGAKLADTNTEQIVAYGGYTRRISDTVSWDAGATNSSFARASYYDFAEAYVGLASENLSGRVYYSPSYFNQKTHTVYAEINAAWLLQENVHLLGHIGVLHPVSGNDVPPSALSSRYDARLGVSARIADCVAQVAWVALQKHATDYPTYEDRNPHAVVFSLSYSF